MKFNICDLRFTNCGKFLASLLLCSLALTSHATPFFVQSFNSDGTPQTNKIFVSQYPATSSPFTIYGTNIIYGANVLTVTPNSSGYGTNWIFPGVYRFYVTNLNVSFIANIPDTAVTNSLALYVTNLQSFSGVSLDSYGVATNLLHFAPATNSNSGIVFALGYAPATNSNSGIVFALGYAPATNNYNGITNALGFGPTTNNYAGVTNALGFAPATNSESGITNALGYVPSTNTFNGTTNSLGYMPATNAGALAYGQLPFTPPTNTYSGLTNAMGFKPRTNDGYLGLISSVGSVATNGFVAWVCYQTNAVPGPAYTNLPTGSLMTTTNGAMFVLSNLVWNPK